MPLFVARYHIGRWVNGSGMHGDIGRVGATVVRSRQPNSHLLQSHIALWPPVPPTCPALCPPLQNPPAVWLRAGCGLAGRWARTFRWACAGAPRRPRLATSFCQANKQTRGLGKQGSSGYFTQVKYDTTVCVSLRHSTKTMFRPFTAEGGCLSQVSDLCLENRSKDK